MDFDLNENQEEMRNALRTLLQGACDIRHVRQVAYDGDGRDPGLWKALADGGWTALMVPEAEGGSGLRFEDFIVAARGVRTRGTSGPADHYAGGGASNRESVRRRRA